MSSEIIKIILTILSMERLKEKAQLEFNCKTIDQLIDVFEDIKTVMGEDVKVGRVNTIRPSINVQLFDYGDAIVLLN